MLMCTTEYVMTYSLKEALDSIEKAAETFIKR